MKSKTHYLLMLSTTIIISAPSLCFSQQPNPKIWEPLGSGSYYNKKIITKAPGVLLVWTYKMMTNDARAKRIEEVKKYNLEKSVIYQTYHHEADLWEVDCRNKLIRMEEFIDFDKNGKVLDRYRYYDSEWGSIMSGSSGDRLYQNACTPRKQPYKKRRSSF